MYIVHMYMCVSFGIAQLFLGGCCYQYSVGWDTEEYGWRA